MNPKHYHGRPCKYGHGTLRYASDNGCIECATARKASRKKAKPEEVRAATRAQNRRYRAIPENQARGKAYRAENREKMLAATRRWRKAHPERANAWARANPERVRELKAAWGEAHPEKPRAYVRKWALANPEKQSVDRAKRRARLAAAPGNGVSAGEWKAALADSLGLCVYCTDRTALTMDHIDPLALGGAHDIDNIAAACLSCNTSKSDTPLLLWLARQRGR
jgi:5-methylcytosine-specific restriction endonuclease McrA